MSKPQPSSRDKVRAHRERMRAQGLRQVTRWVIDTRSPEVMEQIAREARAIGEAERNNPAARREAALLYALSDEMLTELDRTEPYDWGPEGPPV